MNIFNKYEYGYNAYKKGFDYGCNPQSKSLSNELKCITYYLKQNGKSLDEVIEYMDKQLDIIYSFVRDKDMYKKHRINMITREYNLECNSVKFCEAEINYLNKHKINEARVIFYIMCMYKLYGNDDVELINRDIRNKFNSKMNVVTVDTVIYKLNTEGVINTKIMYSKSDVKFVTTISKEITNMYDGNCVYEFSNLGNLQLLFEYVTGKNKNVILCAKCGLIEEKTNNKKKYCELCAFEIKQEMTKSIVYESRNYIC